MDLTASPSAPVPKSFPHTRGDGPVLKSKIGDFGPFSPHTWGWTHNTLSHQRRRAVFPTHVGMDHKRMISADLFEGFPHTRGDGPPRFLLHR